MKKPGPVPVPAVLLFLGIAVVVRLASRHAPIFAFLSPDLLAAVLFLYAPFFHYRRGMTPSWLNISNAGRSARLALALAAGGALAYFLFTRLPLPPTLVPYAGPPPPLPELLFHELLLVALPEEVFFRGYLYDAFEEKGWEPVVPSSVLFAAGHLLIFASWYRALTFFPGLLLGWSRKSGGNIYVPVFLHLLFNLLPYAAGGMH
ncbi:MAG: Abortive infection protein [Actinobacteria bacterium]|nr:Abortive infection protein [Actinomycetota bacterium]MBM2827892.1 Abortive infection protein [Actinomycetota bacterium]